jgi:predicted lipase
MKNWIPFLNAPYCNDGLANWTCVPCKGFSQGTSNITLLGKFTKVYGLTAVHNPSKSVIVSFRGTRNLNNWLNNLLFAKPDVPFPSAPEGAKVHYGFLKDYLQVREGLVYSFSKLRKALPDYKVYFIGHSLGGALAVLAALDLDTLHKVVILSLFNSLIRASGSN